MALECYIGPEQNLLDVTPEHAHRLRVPHPILSNEELTALKHMNHRGWRTRTIDITFPARSGKAGLVEALDRICAKPPGHRRRLQPDRAVRPRRRPGRVPISSLLAVGTVHHHLVRTHDRTRIGLLLETGEAREVHHHCLLVGYGADAINPLPRLRSAVGRPPATAT
jgi:glutamate synthase (NADPH) large chain